MLAKVYSQPSTVDRVRASWIGASIEQYVVWLFERRYSLRSIQRRVPIVMAFGEFAKSCGAATIQDLPAHVEPFVKRWGTERCLKLSGLPRKKAQDCVRNPIRQTLQIAIPGYVGMGRKRKPENPFCKRAPHFFEYLRVERGLRESTIECYLHYLRQFSEYLDRIGVRDVRQLSAPVLSGFAVDYRQRVKWEGLRNACGVVRVFLRYLHREGVLARDLSDAVEAPQRFRLAGVPRSITWDQVRAVLDGVDRRSATGKRDYAVLLLLVTYGLRAHEVASLTLDDLDWRNERLRVPERKAGHSTAYPLSTIVGEAILDYLKHGRPLTQDRKLFFRSQAPLAPIQSAAIVCCAARYIRKAGIQVPRPGSHTLRHTCVQRLVDADFSLKSIGDYVGHRSPSSTQIYGKVAIEALRTVALGDGEMVL